MSFAVKEDCVADKGEELAPHHVRIKSFFPRFRGLARSVAAPATDQEPEPKKKREGFVAMEGKLNGGHVERFELHRVSPLVFKFVRHISRMDWLVPPVVLSESVDAARKNKSEWVEIKISGELITLNSKQLSAGLRYLLSIK